MDYHQEKASELRAMEQIRGMSKIASVFVLSACIRHVKIDLCHAKTSLLFTI